MATHALCNKNHENHYCVFRKGTERRKTAGTGDKPRQNCGKAIFNSSPIVFPRCVTPRAELNIDLFLLFGYKKKKAQTQASPTTKNLDV